MLHDSDFLGETIHTTAAQNNPTMRGGGGNQIGEIIESTRRGDHASDDSDTSLYPYCKRQVGQYLRFSAGDVGNHAAPAIESSGSTLFQLHEDEIWHLISINDSALEKPTGNDLLVEGGRWVTVTDVTGYTLAGPTNGNEGNILWDGPDNVIINGNKSTTLGFTQPVYLDDDGETAYVLPIPTAPR